MPFGFVEYNEYCDLIKEFSKPLETIEIELREAFRYFDKDGNGILDVKELKLALMSLGNPLAEEEVKELIALMDFDENGKVDIEDNHKTKWDVVWICNTISLVLPYVILVSIPGRT
ncbi:hypothetical protein CHS0354_003932 [Potamilus streckersoni]|uniref:EF-hand domain-containing protein n=1 Tax=Potamilus streckersoni TaxID=2493646 RepID=A0AAE0S3N5_9BIVA|nr:hypothetical protein CHS0354_003932 [Potamilus streckersoni]